MSKNVGINASVYQNILKGWEVLTLEQIAEPSAPIRYGVVQIGPDTENGVPIVPIKYINKIETSPLHRASVDIEKKYTGSRVKGGDVLISVKATIGDVGVVPEGFKGNIAREIARIRPLKKYDSHFIAMQLQADATQRRIAKLTVGSTRQEFSIHAVRNFPIAVPKNISEQYQIVETISAWEQTIEKTEALIDAKERQFGWLQKSVLDDDFKSYGGHLSDYAGIMKQQKIEEVGNLKPLTVKLHCKGIEANERDVQITLSKKGRPYFQRFSGEFLIGRQNFHNGGFGIVPEQLDGFIASSAITTLEIDPAKLDPKYLFYFFSRKDYYLRIGHIMDGTGQKELSDKQIMKLPVSIPGIDKQKEVVALLNTAQEEINLLKKLANQYCIQKRGLMQKLLSGKGRGKG